MLELLDVSFDEVFCTMLIVLLVVLFELLVLPLDEPSFSVTEIDTETGDAEISSSLFKATISAKEIAPLFPDTPDFVLNTI